MNLFTLLRTEAGGLELVTSPLSSGIILPGVTRRSIIEMVSTWPGITVSERKITMGEVIAALAAGRLVGSLSVLTARGDDESGYTAAMLASWVSQASFEPLGLTVAVAKDRAIESMMQVGGAGLHGGRGAAGWERGGRGGEGGEGGCAAGLRLLRLQLRCASPAASAGC